MSEAKPSISPDPAPGTSQTLSGVPGLAFSSAMRLTCPKGGEIVPGGGRLVAELPPGARHSVLQLAPEPGPHTEAVLLRVMVTFAPCSPPLSATAGLTFPEPPPRQKT